jgi:membrane fusion protein (multidrug efflux system)
MPWPGAHRNPRSQPLSISSELSGRIAAPRIAEVRARVAGVVLQRAVQGRQRRQTGRCAVRIDPAPSRPTWTAPKPPAQGRGPCLPGPPARAATPVGRRQGHQRQDYDNARAAVRRPTPRWPPTRPPSSAPS